MISKNPSQHILLKVSGVTQSNRQVLALIRVVTSRVIWEFDLKLDVRSRDWVSQKGYILNVAGDPLYVEIKSRA